MPQLESKLSCCLAFAKSSANLRLSHASARKQAFSLFGVRQIFRKFTLEPCLQLESKLSRCLAFAKSSAVNAFCL
jgi:hypothetical protein